MRRQLLLDVASVVVFAGVGRLAHRESLTLAAWSHTAWPFLAGLGLAWLIVLRAGPASLRSGLAVTVTTVVVGMALRALTAQGVAVSFVVVATTVLGLLFMGSRGFALRSRRRRTSPDA